ncbi:hypothetical protein B0H13DRAFT_1934819 [Mycena leptocephala]|nr:hypothetical protein B0H13DRAFT_1934819 [Mycena leptocephala]
MTFNSHSDSLKGIEFCVWCTRTETGDSENELEKGLNHVRRELQEFCNCGQRNGNKSTMRRTEQQHKYISGWRQLRERRVDEERLEEPRNSSASRDDGITLGNRSGSRACDFSAQRSTLGYAFACVAHQLLAGKYLFPELVTDETVQTSADWDDTFISRFRRSLPGQPMLPSMKRLSANVSLARKPKLKIDGAKSACSGLFPSVEADDLQPREISVNQYFLQTLTALALVMLHPVQSPPQLQIDVLPPGRQDAFRLTCVGQIHDHVLRAIWLEAFGKP